MRGRDEAEAAAGGTPLSLFLFSANEDGLVPDDIVLLAVSTFAICGRGRRRRHWLATRGSNKYPCQIKLEMQMQVSVHTTHCDSGSPNNQQPWSAKCAGASQPKKRDAPTLLILIGFSAILPCEACQKSGPLPASRYPGSQSFVDLRAWRSSQLPNSTITPSNHHDTQTKVPADLQPPTFYEPPSASNCPLH